MIDLKASELYTSKTKRYALYNIMPIDNIPSVMDKGILCHRESDKLNHKSIAMQEVQDRREGKNVQGGRPLHDYANLYFDPRNPMMYKKKSLASDLCILRISLEVLDMRDVVVSDQNAASNYARFYNPLEGISNLDFRTILCKDWTSADQVLEWQQKSKKCAEVLVPICVPYNLVSGAYVVDERAREKVESAGFDKKIIVCGELFFRG